MNFTKNQIDYIRRHGGIVEDGFVTISYKSFRKIPKCYADRDICDRKRHVWLIPEMVLLVEGVHFQLVKEVQK